MTSIDREGTAKGFDLELTGKIAQSVSIPIIACGGAGCIEHVHQVVTQGQADAVCLATILHYNLLNQFGDADFSSEGNIEYLKNRMGVSPIRGASLAEIKESMVRQSIPCRPSPASEIHV